jgi:hypothetical protein
VVGGRERASEGVLLIILWMSVDEIIDMSLCMQDTGAGESLNCTAAVRRPVRELCLSMSSLTCMAHSR